MVQQPNTLTPQPPSQQTSEYSIIQNALNTQAEAEGWTWKNNTAKRSTGHSVNKSKVADKFIELGMQVDVSHLSSMIDEVAKNRTHTITSAWAPKYQTVYTISEFITLALDYNNILVGPTGESIQRYGVDLPYDTLESIIKEFSREYEDDSYAPGVKEPQRKIFQVARVSDALKVFISNRDVSARNQLRHHISFVKESGEAHYAFNLLMRVMELFDVKEDYTLCTLIMMQWMWQAKRYLMDMPVVEPIMVNFMGHHQGTMKTSFIEALTHPFKQYRIPSAQFKQVLDEREFTLWSKKYIVIFDELQKGRIEANQYASLVTAMKSLLTAKTVGGRVMKTTNHIEMKRIFSAISSSNASIVHTIRDRTGMRRFFEINVQTKIRANPQLIDIVNTILDPENPYIAMVWQSIDEHRSNGYFDVEDLKTKMYSIQDTYIPAEPLDLWLSSDDVRDRPIKETDMEEKHINSHIAKLTACTTKADIEAMNSELSPVKWVLDYTMNKEATEWAKEEMGQDTAKFMGGRDHLTTYLNTQGYITQQKDFEMYILCKEPSGMLMAQEEERSGI